MGSRQEVDGVDDMDGVDEQMGWARFPLNFRGRERFLGIFRDAGIIAGGWAG